MAHNVNSHAHAHAHAHYRAFPVLMERTGSTVVSAQLAAMTSAAALAKVDPLDTASVLHVAKQMRLTFVDLSFPPDVTPGSDAVQWLRIREAASRLSPDPPSPSSIHTDCHPLVVPGICSSKRWLCLLTLISSADLVPSEACVLGPGGGHVLVNLPDAIIVDDLVPWRKGMPMHALCTPEPEAGLWVPLAEKALAKCLGGYARVSSVTPTLAAAALALSDNRRGLEETPFSTEPSQFESIASSQALVLLRPLCLPSGTLQQPKALYTVAAVANRRVLVYTPIVEKHMTAPFPAEVGLRAIDAQWVSVEQLHIVFESWCVVTDSATGTYVTRPRCPVDLSTMHMTRTSSPGTIAETVPAYRSGSATPLWTDAVPTQSPSRRVVQLQREVDAMTHIHMEALKGGAGGAERVRILQDTMARLQEENAAMTAYHLQDDVLSALGRRWVPEGAGVTPDYSGLVQRQSARIEGLERRLASQEAGFELNLARLREDSARRESECEQRYVREIEMQRSEVQRLEHDLRTANAATIANQVNFPPAHTELLHELERTVTALSEENANNKAALRTAATLEADLLQARDTIKILTAELNVHEATNLQTAQHNATHNSHNEQQIAALESELQRLLQHNALQAPEQLAASLTKDNTITALRAELQEAQTLRVQTDAKIAEKEEIVRIRDAALVSAESEAQLFREEAAEAKALATRREGEMVQLRLQMDQQVLYPNTPTTLPDLVHIEPQNDRMFTALANDYQQKLARCQEDAMLLERQREEEKQGLIALNVKEMARNATSVESLEQDRSVLQSALEELSLRYEGTAAALAEFADEKPILLGKIALLTEERDELTDRRACEQKQMFAAHEELASINTSLTERCGALEERTTTLSSLLETAQEELSVTRQTGEEQNQAMTRLIQEKRDILREHAEKEAIWETERDTLQREIRSLQRTIEERDDVIESLTKEKMRLKAALEEAENTIEVLRGELREAREQIWELTKERDELANQVARLTETVEGLRIALQEALDEKARLAEELAESSSRLKTTLLELSAAHAVNTELRSEADSLRQAIFRGDDALKVAESTIADLQATKQNLVDKNTGLMKDLQHNEEERDGLKVCGKKEKKNYQKI